MNTKFIDIKRSREEMLNKVANFIKTRRTELGISQDLLSEMSGVERAYISRLERGKKPGFTFGIIIKLFKALNIKWAELDKL